MTLQELRTAMLRKIDELTFEAQERRGAAGLAAFLASTQLAEMVEHDAPLLAMIRVWKAAEDKVKQTH